MTYPAPPVTLSATDPVAVRLTAAIESGALDELSTLLDGQPGLANARIAARRKNWRTPLHVVTHWPGYFPNGPAVVGLLIDAGADPSARSAEGPSETPLHWAASNDDADVAAALIDGGADIDAPGGSIAGGSPLNNAVGYGCWHVARLLVAHGAAVDELWLAAGLGLDRHVEALLDAGAPSQDGLDEAFWQACHGGQLRTAQLLAARGARIDATPDYGSGQTPLDIAGHLDERRSQLLRWLSQQSATPATPSTPS